MQVIQQLNAPGQQEANSNTHIGASLLRRAHDWLHGPQWMEPGSSGRPHVESNEVASIRQVAAGPVSAASAAAGPDVPAPEPMARLAAARQVRAAKLIGPRGMVGLMWLHLYPEQGFASRVLKVTDRHLAKALRKYYFSFGDVPFDPAAGFVSLFDAMRAECEKVLEGRAGKVRVKQIHTRSESHLPPSVNPGVRKALAPARPEHAVALGKGCAAAGIPALQGESYEGVVTSAGRTSIVGPDGVSYNTFCLTLSDGLREMPLFGTELERQFAGLGLRAGERARIAFMGKVLTEVPGKNRPAFRNLFHLARVDAP